MENIFKCKDKLNNIYKTKNKRRRIKLLKNLNSSEVNTISEISKNCLLGNIPLRSCEFKNLKKFSKYLRLLARKNISLKNKKKILIQRGGFLTSLIAPALALLGQYLFKKITKND